MKIGGVEVKDADEKIVVKITKQDVRKGALRNANSCAAANALCRQEHCDEARVHFSRAYIRRGKKWVRFKVPAALRAEILAFDRGGEFKAGEYVLSPMQASVRFDRPTPPSYKNRKKKAHRPGAGNRVKRPYHLPDGVRARMMADWE
jgi:hypothetical protein